uniref:hypothetical protein n=1 Tax=Roseivirga sp. TaxID=1964215 RepID=UPI004047A5DC
MNKLVLGIVFTLCALLAVGHTYFGQFNNRNFTQSSSFSSSDNGESASLEQGQTFITVPPLYARTQDVGFYAAEKEIEEEEVVSHKKYLAGSAILIAIICALSLGYFSRFIKKRLAASKRFCDILSHRLHLLLQVFTI